MHDPKFSCSTLLLQTPGPEPGLALRLEHVIPSPISRPPLLLIPARLGLFPALFPDVLGRQRDLRLGLFPPILRGLVRAWRLGGGGLARQAVHRPSRLPVLAAVIRRHHLEAVFMGFLVHGGEPDVICIPRVERLDRGPLVHVHFLAVSDQIHVPFRTPVVDRPVVLVDHRDPVELP